MAGNNYMFGNQMHWGYSHTQQQFLPPGMPPSQPFRPPMAQPIQSPVGQMQPLMSGPPRTYPVESTSFIQVKFNQQNYTNPDNQQQSFQQKQLRDAGSTSLNQSAHAPVMFSNFMSKPDIAPKGLTTSMEKQVAEYDSQKDGSQKKGNQELMPHISQAPVSYSSYRNKQDEKPISSNIKPNISNPHRDRSGRNRSKGSRNTSRSSKSNIKVQVQQSSTKDPKKDDGAKGVGETKTSSYGNWNAMEKYGYMAQAEHVYHVNKPYTGRMQKETMDKRTDNIFGLPQPQQKKIQMVQPARMVGAGWPKGHFEKQQASQSKGNTNQKKKTSKSSENKRPAAIVGSKDDTRKDGIVNWGKCDICNCPIPGNTENAYRNHCRSLLHLQKMVDQQVQDKKKSMAKQEDESSIQLQQIDKNLSGSFHTPRPYSERQDLTDIGRECDMCNIPIVNFETYLIHIQSKKHAKMAFLYLVHFDDKKKTPYFPVKYMHLKQTAQSFANSSGQDGYTCQICETHMVGDLAFIDHLNGTVHKIRREFYTEEHIKFIEMGGSDKPSMITFDYGHKSADSAEKPKPPNLKSTESPGNDLNSTLELTANILKQMPGENPSIKDVQTLLQHTLTQLHYRPDLGNVPAANRPMQQPLVPNRPMQQPLVPKMYAPLQQVTGPEPRRQVPNDPRPIQFPQPVQQIPGLDNELFKQHLAEQERQFHQQVNLQSGPMSSYVQPAGSIQSVTQGVPVNLSGMVRPNFQPIPSRMVGPVPPVAPSIVTPPGYRNQEPIQTKAEKSIPAKKENRGNQDKPKQKKYAVDFLLDVMQGKQDSLPNVRDVNKIVSPRSRVPRRSPTRSSGTKAKEDSSRDRKEESSRDRVHKVCTPLPSPRRRRRQSRSFSRSPQPTVRELPEKCWYDVKLLSDDMIKYKYNPPNLEKDQYLDWFFEKYGVEKFTRPNVMTSEVFTVWNWRQYKRFEVFLKEFYRYKQMFDHINYDAYFNLYFDGYFEEYYTDIELCYEEKFDHEQQERLKNLDGKSSAPDVANRRIRSASEEKKQGWSPRRERRSLSRERKRSLSREQRSSLSREWRRSLSRERKRSLSRERRRSSRERRRSLSRERRNRLSRERRSFSKDRKSKGEHKPYPESQSKATSERRRSVSKDRKKTSEPSLANSSQIGSERRGASPSRALSDSRQSQANSKKTQSPSRNATKRKISPDRKASPGRKQDSSKQQNQSSADNKEVQAKNIRKSHEVSKAEVSNRDTNKEDAPHNNGSSSLDPASSNFDDFYDIEVPTFNEKGQIEDNVSKNLDKLSSKRTSTSVRPDTAKSSDEKSRSTGRSSSAKQAERKSPQDQGRNQQSHDSRRVKHSPSHGERERSSSHRSKSRNEDNRRVEIRSPVKIRKIDVMSSGDLKVKVPQKRNLDMSRPPPTRSRSPDHDYRQRDVDYRGGSDTHRRPEEDYVLHVEPPEHQSMRQDAKRQHKERGHDIIPFLSNTQLSNVLSNTTQIAEQLQPLLSDPQGAVLTDVIQKLSTLQPEVLQAMASGDPDVIAHLSGQLDPQMISALNEIGSFGLPGLDNMPTIFAGLPPSNQINVEGGGHMDIPLVHSGHVMGGIDLPTEAHASMGIPATVDSYPHVHPDPMGMYYHADRAHPPNIGEIDAIPQFIQQQRNMADLVSFMVPDQQGFTGRPPERHGDYFH